MAQTKAERIFEALRDPEKYENISLGDSEFFGIPVEVVLAEGVKEEDDKEIAIILTPATLKKLERIEDELEDLRDLHENVCDPDEEDDEDEDEDYEDDGDDEEDEEDRSRSRAPRSGTRRRSGSRPRRGGGWFAP